MLGIFVILIVSWALLHFVEKENILVLGFTPFRKQIIFFIKGVVITICFYLIFHSIEILVRSTNISINRSYAGSDFLQSAWWNFKSVLTEELLFRGALLFIAIKKIGSRRAILASAIAFGIYHWFSYGLFGQLIPMVYVFIITGCMGYALAYAYDKSRTILLPIGLHFGWNFASYTIFGHGPLGVGFFSEQQGSTGNKNIDSLYSLFMHMVVPLLIVILVTKITKPVSPRTSEVAES